jgi:hypothetical protein
VQFSKISIGARSLVLLSLPLVLSFLPTRPLAAAEYAFITTSDYSTGSCAVIYLDGAYTTARNVADVHSDAVARFFDGLIYVVNRMGGDNVQVLDPEDGFSTIRQFSVGNGSDPHDIAFVSASKAYVSRGNETDLLIVDPSTGAWLGAVDLSPLADGDGVPEMDCLFLTGDRLFVSVQRLDRNNYWLPVPPSYLAVVDTEADTLIDCDPASPGAQAIELGGTNPFGDLHLDPYTGFIYFTCVGWWGMADCGVEAVNPATCRSEGFIMNESAAGGDVNDVSILSPSIGYAVVTDAGFDNLLIRFDPSNGEVADTLYAPGGYVLSDIEISPGGELFLCDRTAMDPGVRIYNAYTGEEIAASPIDVGLPPFDITFSVPVQTGCEMPPAAVLGQNYPNPFNPATVIPFSIERDCHVSLVVYDAAGRRVKTLCEGVLQGGGHRAVWDGSNDRGRAVASGVYFVRLRSGERFLTRKLILIR